MRLWRITSLGILFTVFVLVWVFVVGFSSHQGGQFFNKDHNAIWIGHTWVGDYHSEAEISNLVNDFKEHGIDTVFVHTGPFEKNGVIDPKTYQYTVDFLDIAKRFGPEIEYQAWLGQIRSKISLEEDETKANIGRLCMVLTQLIGFDGIHFDIEPVWDEDSEFIETLRMCRVEMPDDKKISVALAEFIPGSVLWMLEDVYKFENYNSEINYENVAEHADQVVIMAYDTGITRDWLYRWLVKEQVIWVTDLLPETEVFIGLPAYEDEKEGFDPEVENIENGLMGVVSGLNNFRSDEESFAGVAIYSYWEMSEEEWEIYNTLWGNALPTPAVD